MNIASIRTAVADAYPRRGWREKVKKMSDEQVFAMYKSMERNGRLFNHAKKDDKRERVQDRVTREMQRKADSYDRAVEKVLLG